MLRLSRQGRSRLHKIMKKGSRRPNKQHVEEDAALKASDGREGGDPGQGNMAESIKPTQSVKKYRSFCVEVGRFSLETPISNRAEHTDPDIVRRQSCSALQHAVFRPSLASMN